MAKGRNDRYKDHTKEELINEIERLKERKRYGVVWEEKREEVVERCKGELPVIKEVKGREIRTDPRGPVNLLIEGDNYHSLSVLNYTHAKKVDVIYIDPPYNTGNKDFIFNDHYVDCEDGYRHSKWLSFMEKRLKLAKNLLKDTGVIFISIDDNEVAQLKLLMSNPDLFRENNFVANFVRKNKVGGGHDSGEVAIEFDYMLCYAKDKSRVIFNKEMVDVDNDPKYRFVDRYIEKRGKYYLRDLDYKGSYSRTLDYGLKAPGGKILYAGGKIGKPNTWRWSKDKVEWGKKNDFIVFKKDNHGNWKVYIKQYQFVDNEDMPRTRVLPHRALIQFINAKGSQELQNILKQEIFTYPKPIGLIKFVSKLVPNKNATILDFFAGTGTTGQAVLELNKEDGGNRQFILCTNNENNICTNVCYPRIKKVIEGYKNLKGERVDGLGGNLKYFKTDFVDAEPTDKNKIKLTKRATEMLCVKEETFEPVVDNERFKIFKNSNHYTGIIWDQTAIPKFKKKIEGIGGKFSIYVFSLEDETFDDEFEDVKQKVRLSPIPEAILKVYRRIFR